MYITPWMLSDCLLRFEKARVKSVDASSNVYGEKEDKIRLCMGLPHSGGMIKQMSPLLSPLLCYLL